MSILREFVGNKLVELVHGVEVQVFNLNTGKRVFHKTFTSLDDKRDARACFEQQVAACKVIA